MRIDQLASYAQMSRLQSLRPTEFQGGRNLSGAQQANQARLSDAAKGFVQATRVRDGAAAQGKGIGQAKELLLKAKDQGLSADDKKKLQADLTKALASVAQGGKDQSAAVADKTLANKTYVAKADAAVSADQLGRKASSQFGSVADLSKLDLSTATPDQLAEAAKVLDAAKSENDTQLSAANRQVDVVSRRTDTLNGVQSALDGTSTLSAKQQHDISLITSLLQQQGAQVTPGSLFGITA